MSYPVAVIPSKVWVNEKTGARASIYGAVPWVFGPQPPEWQVKDHGFTLQMSNGTVGYGRSPLPTKEEAQDVMDKWLKRIGRA
jgi:hypothetical protein